MISKQQLSIIYAALCCFAGALTPLSLAPFNYWPIAIFCLATLSFCLHNSSKRQCFLYSWLFGIGLFASGASWVYVSIHDYGYAPIILSVFLTGLFVIGLGLVFALPFYFCHRLWQKKTVSLLLSFPACWVLGEWLRSWLLTGFPWLYLGYAHVETPLSGWMPITGVFGVSLIIAFCSVTLSLFFMVANNNKILAGSLTLSLFFFIAGFLLKNVQWVTNDLNSPIHVGIVQANIPLDEKWLPENREKIKQIHRQLSEPLWNKDIILWPEAAIPELHHQAENFLATIDKQGKQSSTTLITGIPYRHTKNTNDDKERYHYFNSITAIGNGEGIYHKVKLVPFGEYIPLENILRGLIRFFDLPMSNFTRGQEQQTLLSAGKFHFSPYICYEIVYPDFVAKRAKSADFLITISNDSWFGKSIGPLQHLQMAQARALENNRYLIRGTNNGISAIINTQGKITVASKQFKREVILGTIYPSKGITPFGQLASWPIIILCFFLLVISYSTSQNRSNIKPT